MTSRARIDYDETTGQVYTETATPVQSMIETWMMTSKGARNINPAKHRNPGPGAPSLRNATLRLCAWNMGNPGMAETMIHFRDPEKDHWAIFEEIYQIMKKQDALSFRAWATFKAVAPEQVKETMFPVNIRQNSGTGTDKLSSISYTIATLPFDTLTFLCIRDLTITRVCLHTDLLKFQNLAVLALEQYSTSVYGTRNVDGEDDDRLIRKWGLSVQQQQAFKKLRVLILKGFSVGASALGGPTMFPALRLCNLDSWYIMHDLNNSLQEGKVFNDSKWCHILPDSQDPHPETTYNRRDITTHQKLEILYDLSYSVSSNPSPKPSATVAPAISIAYGDPTPREAQANTHSAWFTRVDSLRKPHIVEGVKRTIDDKVPTSKKSKDGANKKRKVRQGKHNDLGSLLGAFGL